MTLDFLFDDSKHLINDLFGRSTGGIHGKRVVGLFERGMGAEHAGQDFVALVKRYPGIAGNVEASVLVADRRWNLHLKSGIEVLLPEGEPEQALQTLAELDRSKQILARDIVTVDLRLPYRVTVRLSDAAAAARDEALKAAAEKTKKKGKGGEA